MTAERHAVYWAPAADSLVWRAGCAWLGRDARDGQPVQPPASSRVAEPWRYGLHATLKAPMRLAPGVKLHDWLAAVRALAAQHADFEMPGLQVDVLADFIALRPQHVLTADHPLRRLADDCVLQLDRFRAPPLEAELKRQLWPGFSLRQRQQVQKLGYAHVLDDWRLHLTLSNALDDPAARADVQTEAKAHFAEALRQPLRCEAICIFVEPAPGQALVLRHRFPLSAR